MTPILLSLIPSCASFPPLQRAFRFLTATLSITAALAASSPHAEAATLITSFEQATAAVKATGSAPNWTFYWNKNGSIGDISGYEELVKMGSTNNYELIPPNGQFGQNPAGYLKISYQGGSTGFGTMNTAGNPGSLARGPVAAYTFQEAGHYQITNIQLSRSTAKADEVLSLNVWLAGSTTPIGTLILPHATDQDAVATLDLVDLGYLESGSTVYVTVDPGPYAGARFNMAYDIIAIPEPSAASLITASLLAGLVISKVRITNAPRP